MKKLYFRCNGGDYFTESPCPFDGCIFPHEAEVNSLVAKLALSKTELSLTALREAGLGEHIIEGLVVIEFNSRVEFEAVSADGCYVKSNGKLLSRPKYYQRRNRAAN